MGQLGSRAVELFAPQREARPWSIRVASADGGPSEVIFRADEGASSVPSGIDMSYSPDSGGGLVWSPGGQIALFLTVLDGVAKHESDR